MPIYEYHCESCSKEFELLTNSSTVAECPECHSRKVTKQFSTFAARGTRSVSPATSHVHTPTCGCGKPGGMCGMMN